MKRTYSQIDLDERRKIARWRTAGPKVRFSSRLGGRIMFAAFIE